MAIRIDGDNTTANPGITGGDADTGLQFGTDEVSIVTGGTEQAKVDSAGRLLVGTSSTTTNGSIVAQGDSNGPINGAKIWICRGESATNIGDDELLGRIYFSDADQKEYARIEGRSDDTAGTDNYPGQLVFSTTEDGDAQPTNRIRVQDNGVVNIRSNTSSQCRFGTLTGAAFQNSENYITVYGNASGNRVQISGRNVADGTPCFEIVVGGTRQLEIEADGDIYNLGGNYGQISDAKLKENIVDAGSQWDDIKALRVRNFNFREDLGHDPKTQIGFVAQEVEEVSPGLVQTNLDKDPDGNELGTETKVVKTSVLYVKAVKALQEAIAKIETLEAKVAALEAN